MKPKQKQKSKYTPVNMNNMFTYASKEDPKPEPAYMTQKDQEWFRYFGIDGTCLEHDLLRCGICRRLATYQCFSALEE